MDVLLLKNLLIVKTTGHWHTLSERYNTLQLSYILKDFEILYSVKGQVNLQNTTFLS